MRKALLALTSSAAIIGLAACGSTAPAGPGDDDSRRLLLGHGAEPGNPRSTAADEFSERVGEETDDRIEVQVLPGESLGSDSDMMISVASGTLDMSVNSQGPFSPVVPEVNLVGLPFLFENAEHAYEVIDGETGDYLAEQAEERGTTFSRGGTTAFATSPTARGRSIRPRIFKASRSARQTIR